MSIHYSFLKNEKSQIDIFSQPEKRIVFHTIADTFVNNTLTKIDKHRQLKNMFIDVINTLPDFVKEISLKDALPYLNRNAANVWKF